VRTKEVARENGFWAVESATSPELAKDPFGNGRIDGCESLGQVEGAQGVLIQPECVRGCSIPSLPLRYVGEMKLTWRGSYDVQVAARMKRTGQGFTPGSRPACD